MMQLLRNKILKKRMSLSAIDILLYSKNIHKFLEELFFRKYQSFFTYLSYNNEVDTYALVQRLYGENKNVLIPATEVKNKKIIPVCVSEDSFQVDLVPGFCGIPQPHQHLVECAITSSQHIDIVICPGSLFDISGARVGYGGGYYDRLLCREEFKNVIKVGVCFDFQLFESIEQQDHDIQMDYIVTPSRVICLNSP